MLINRQVINIGVNKKITLKLFTNYQIFINKKFLEVYGLI